MSNQVSTFAKNNISTPMVVSTVVGMAVFGAITYFAVKSGVKPLKQVSEVVKGAK